MKGAASEPAVFGGGGRKLVRFGRLGAVLATSCVASLSPATAQANSAMGLKGLGEAFIFLIGVATLLLAAILGALSWVTVLRPPKAVSGIFGRGFLGVSAVIAFAVGGLCVLLSTTSFAKGGFAGTALVTVTLLTCVFLVVEFAIAGRLYWRSSQHRPSRLAKALSVVSFVFAGLFALSGCGVALLALVGLLMDDSKPRMNVQTSRYRDGCEDNVASDCNMLGLHYRAGSSGLPRDSVKAAEALQKGCDLESAIACRNLATQYKKGDGVPQDDARAEQLMRRYELLRSQGKR